MAGQFTLYEFDLSPNCLRVRAVINELGVEVKTVSVDFMGGGLRTAEFLALNPNGKVPVLKHGDLVIWESRAITAYLAALHPESGLYPAELSRRAAVDQWSYWQAVHLGPTMQRVAFERFVKAKVGRGGPDEGAIANDVKAAASLLGVLDAALEGRDWICGSLSLADFALGTTFMYRRQASLSLEALPNVGAWIERLEARPSWRTAVAPIVAWAG